MRWMIKDLDQTQEIVLREVISHSGVSWVDGFAGSGKSIVAAHICNRLKRSTPSAKIALITYTHALKEMLQVGMNKLSPNNCLRGISELVGDLIDGHQNINTSRLVSLVLKAFSRDPSAKISLLIKNEPLKKCFQRFAPEGFQEKVTIKTYEDLKKSNEYFDLILYDKNLGILPDQIEFLRTLCSQLECVEFVVSDIDLFEFFFSRLSVSKEVEVTTHTDLLKSDKKNMHYDVIVLDEVQDIPLCDIKKIKLMCTRLVLAGDVDQSIYANGITAEDLRSNLQPKEQRLRKIFRLTEKARRIALSVLPNANVVAGENASNRAEADIKRVNFNDNGEEANWVYEDACNRARPDYPSGIFLTTHSEIRKFAELVAAGAGLPKPPRRAKSFINGGKNEDRYADFNAFWKSNGHPLRVLGSGSGDLSKSSNEPIVYLTTYHSAKGLDFQNVYLPRSVEGINLDPTGNGGEKLERRLMFVAITRTRENLFITHTGTRAHRYIEELPSADIIRISNPKRHNFTQELGNDIF